MGRVSEKVVQPGDYRETVQKNRMLIYVRHNKVLRSLQKKENVLNQHSFETGTLLDLVSISWLCQRGY